jgi:hypothetical protein
MANNRLVLPDFGQDWFSEMRGRYIILSLKHSTKEITMFFKAHCLGYTDCLINAGIFTKTEIIIHLGYYKGDIIAVPLTRDAFCTLGLYPIVADYDKAKLFVAKEIAHTQE